MAAARATSTDGRQRLWARLMSACRLLATPNRQREVILGLFLLLCYGFFYQVPLWNEPSRYDLIRAIVDDGTLRIDPYHENTGDKAFFDGHYYSDKLPGSSLLALPTYALIRMAVRVGLTEPPDDRAAYHALAYSASGIPSVVTALLLLRFLCAHVASSWALTVTLGYAIGTIAFPFATMFFGHAASTASLFLAFYLLWRSRQHDQLWRPALAGLCAGLAVLTELPVALGVIVLLGYCALTRPRSLSVFILGGMPPAVALLAYNWLAFEHPLRLGYQFTVNFSEAHSHGVGGIGLPSPATFVDLMISPRGLLRLSPWLAFTPLGLAGVRNLRLRAEVVLCASIVTTFVLYNSGFFSPFGGASPGPRYLTPALPFAAVLVALIPLMFRAIAELGILVSVALVLVATATMPNSLEVVQAPLTDDWLPRLVVGDLAETTAWRRFGMVGLQPVGVLAVAALAAVAALPLGARTVPHLRYSRHTALATLTILVLVFGTPMWLPRLGLWEATHSNSQSVVILDAGVTVGVEDGYRLIARPWVRVENDGSSSMDLLVQFAIASQSGERVWSNSVYAGHWVGGERRHLDIDADLSGHPPGIYQFSLQVLSPSDGHLITTKDRISFNYDRL